MRFLAVIIILLPVVAGALYAADDAPEGIGRRVFDAEALDEAGVARLSDIMLLIDGWAPVTVDGFSWQSSPRGLDVLQTQQWIVVVDGIRVDINLLGVTSLNRIPVNAGQIDSVEVVSVPQFYQGEFADGGLIHIFTKRAGNGVEVHGAAFSGNESGDPGPYRYTEYSSPNVDRIGPDYAADVAYGATDVYAGAEFNSQRHYATDSATRYRNFAISSGAYPQIELGGGAAAAGGKLFGGWLHGFFGSSKLEDYFFYKPYGREIPIVSRLTTTGVRGHHTLSPGLGLDYRLVYNQNELGYRQNAFDLNFDWRLNTFRAELDLSGEIGRSRNRAGVNFERHEAVTGYALSKNDVVLTRFFADTDIGFARRYRQRFAVSATSGEGDATFDAMTAAEFVVGRRHRFDLVLAYAERRPERDGRIWFWRERGYGFLDDAGVTVTADAPMETARKITLDGAWSFDPGGAYNWRVSAFYREFKDYQLEDQRFAFDADQQAFGGPIHLRAGEGGAMAGGEAVFKFRPDRRVELRTTYRLQSSVSGDDFFKRQWDAVPTHQFRQYASFSPVSSFTIWARLGYLSGTEWYDYRDAATQTDGLYNGTIDGFVCLDAAAQKWFWQRRIRGSLLFTDLLGQSPTYHPIGASFDFSLFVQLEIILGRKHD